MLGPKEVYTFPHLKFVAYLAIYLNLNGGYFLVNAFGAYMYIDKTDKMLKSVR